MWRTQINHDSRSSSFATSQSQWWPQNESLDCFSFFIYVVFRDSNSCRCRPRAGEEGGRGTKGKGRPRAYGDAASAAKRPLEGSGKLLCASGVLPALCGNILQLLLLSNVQESLFICCMQILVEVKLVLFDSQESSPQLDFSVRPYGLVSLEGSFIRLESRFDAS